MPAISLIPLAQATGLKVPWNWRRLAPLGFVKAPEPTSYPWFFDWRNEIEHIPTIVNQGGCGSCWAFGTTAVLNWQYAIHTGEVKMFSEQEILSCSGFGSCGGGYFAHGYQKQTGASRTEEFPYTARDLRCKAGLSHEQRIASWGYIGESRRSPTVDEMKAAIMHYGPIGVTVTANSAMQRFRGAGVFKGCSNGGTNHIVHIVGWDDQVDVGNGRRGAWVMGNSWGRDWGNGGYALIPFGCSRIGEQATFVQFD